MKVYAVQVYVEPVVVAIFSCLEKAENFIRIHRFKEVNESVEIVEFELDSEVPIYNHVAIKSHYV